MIGEGGGNGDRWQDVAIGQDELICQFEMAVSYVISVKREVLKHTSISTRINRELVRFQIDSNNFNSVSCIL